VTATLPSRLVLVVGFGLGTGACAGELANPERFADCQPGGVEAMFEERCTGPCHAGDRPEAGLDLTGADLAARLIGKTSSCDGRMIVDPDGLDTDDHLLLDKLGDSPRCGAQMPFGAEALTDVERECVRRWIDDAIAETR
jgi:hypothetical protein